ncbi:MAG: NADP-dependent oxidoreductase, partial [Woeseiaceae bacterium]
MPVNRQIHLKSRPDGTPTAENFELVTAAVPNPDDGQLLIRNLWMSVDPYMRGRMSDRKSYVPPFKVGRVLNGAAIGEVVESKHSDFAAGDLVSHMSGWREYAINNGQYIEKLPTGAANPELYLGLFGTTGLTAWFGLFDVASLRQGETVFVTAAAGAVGSAACQIARVKKCRVIGSCGSDDKAEWLRKELGVDDVINYRTCGDLAVSLGDAAPDGIDVCFENVGGDHLEAALGNMKPFGRIAVCGMIGAYNAPGGSEQVNNLVEIIARRITMTGFLLMDFEER